MGTKPSSDRVELVEPINSGAGLLAESNWNAFRKSLIIDDSGRGIIAFKRRLGMASILGLPCII
jgi:hypothetical protein